MRSAIASFVSPRHELEHLELAPVEVRDRDRGTGLRVRAKERVGL